MILDLPAKIMLGMWFLAVFITLTIIIKGAIMILTKFKKPKPKKEQDFSNVIFPDDFNPSKRQ